jgi:hypothetical protein
MFLEILSTAETVPQRAASRKCSIDAGILRARTSEQLGFYTGTFSSSFIESSTSLPFRNRRRYIYGENDVELDLKTRC